VHVGGTILNTGRHIWARGSHRVGDLAGPNDKPVAQLLPIWSMNAPPEWRHAFSRRAPPHPYDDGAAEDRVGKPAETRQAKSTEGGNFFRLDLLAPNNASTGDSASAMTGIIQPSDFFILFRLRAEDS